MVSVIRPFWARYLVPSTLEKDAEFRRILESVARGGMRAAGILGLAGAMIYLLAHAAAQGTFVWMDDGVDPERPVALWSKVAIAGMGIGLLTASRIQLRLRPGRLLMSVFLLAGAFVLIQEDISGGNFMFTAGWLTLVMFFAVGTVPFQPWQTGVLCAAITLLYAFLVVSQPASNGGLPASEDVARLIYLGLVTFLCITMSSVIYVSRFEQYCSKRRVRQMQDQLVQKEKLASLGHLAAGIAHEIKNPLNFINNFAQLSQESVRELTQNLAANPNKPANEALNEVRVTLDDLRTNAEKVAEHGHRADSIVKSMLEHSRTMPGERRPVDLNKLADQFIGLAFHAMRAQHTGFDVSVDRDFDEGLEAIPVVPSEIGRVLLNLLDNAFDAVRRRKLVERDGYEPHVLLTTSRTLNGAVITVTDNGIGIPEDHRKQVFEPFFTTKAPGEGTGLGLSLAYDIATAGHGGSLVVDTAKDEGTTFRLELPTTQGDVD